MYTLKLIYSKNFLSEKEFEKVFKMKREKFEMLQEWRQTELKKNVGLF